MKAVPLRGREDRSSQAAERSRSYAVLGSCRLRRRQRHGLRQTGVDGVAIPHGANAASAESLHRDRLEQPPKKIRYRTNARIAMPGTPRPFRFSREASSLTNTAKSAPRSADQSGATGPQNPAKNRRTQKQ